MCRKGVSKSFRVLEDGFGLFRVLNTNMVLNVVFEGVDTVLARGQIFISLILNLERPFFAVLKEFLQGVFMGRWNFSRVFGKAFLKYWGC